MQATQFAAIAIPLLLAVSRVVTRLRPVWDGLVPARLQPWVPVFALAAYQVPFVVSGALSSEELVVQLAVAAAVAAGIVAPGALQAAPPQPPAGPSTRTLILPVAGLLGLFLAGCSAAQASAAGATTAQVVNEVARSGDAIYAVSVAECHAAEVAASHALELSVAKATVAEVRSRCDVAFQALRKAQSAVVSVDAALQRNVSARDLAVLALSAREAVEAAQQAEVELAAFLKSVRGAK